MSNPTPEQILDAVCAEFELPLAYVRSPMRWRHYVQARQIFCYIARIHAHQKWGVIGFMLNRDHCTARDGMQKVKANPAKFEPHLSNLINRLYAQKVAA